MDTILFFTGNQQNAFKPAGFGTTAGQPAATGGLFGSTTPAFGTTGAAPAAGAFGQPQQQTGFGATNQNTSIGLFGAQNNQAKPLGKNYFVQN